MREKPLLSIHCITYNHEKFIARALDGFLMQQTDFDFEIVVGEDCSTDGTRRILLDYKERYPEKIKLILHEKNVGMQTNGAMVGAACKGKYLAICEGDDYWTDSLKLQKQVDFLEANPDFAICFHRVRIKHEDGSQADEISNQNQKEVSTFEDLAAGNFIHTLSCVFRTNLFGALPDWFGGLSVGDYVVHLLNAQHGKIKFLPDIMAVYRVHSGGVWSAQSEERRMLGMYEAVRLCRQHFAPRAQREFTVSLAHFSNLLCVLSFDEGLYEEYRQHFLKKFLPVSTSVAPGILAGLTIRYLLTFSKPLASAYKRAKSRAKKETATSSSVVVR